MDTETKQIIIADDHAVVRLGLQMIFDQTDDLNICDEARNGQELLKKLKASKYDLVILDISMPGKDSLDVLKEIKAMWTQLPVLIFTMNSNDVYAIRMIKAGASAYVNKETKPELILHIVRTVCLGKRYLSPQQSELLADELTKTTQEALPHELLSDREFQIFFMLVAGLKKSEISDKLALSKHTISNHRNNILKKMNLSSNSELTRYAIQQGLIK